MNQFLIIPDRKNIETSCKLADQYQLGFEFNDFFSPAVLDNQPLCRDIITEYKSSPLPPFLTSHGDFFDVLVFSEDQEIRRISEMRIRQSIEVALQIGAGAVILHTNHNPFLKAESYLNNWLDKNEEFFSMILSEYPDINIYMENMFDDSPDLLRKLAERLSSYANFGVCYDYAHAAISRVPNRVWTEALAPFIRHMHINDNDLVADLHLPVGAGRINWEEFMQARESFFPGASILIETTSIENQVRSIEFLKTLGVFS